MSGECLEVKKTDGVWRVVGYLTSYEYAEKAGVKEGTVRKWIYCGRLEAVQIGKGWWVREDAPMPPNIGKMKAEEKAAFMEKNGKDLTAYWHRQNGKGWKSSRRRETKREERA